MVRAGCVDRWKACMRACAQAGRKGGRLHAGRQEDMHAGGQAGGPAFFGAPELVQLAGHEGIGEVATLHVGSECSWGWTTCLKHTQLLRLHLHWRSATAHECQPACNSTACLAANRQQPTGQVPPV